ncbi:J domain-containing protein [Lysobacter yananisis]|uniref:J domain-containing protein n=1 Tax=Lysobacter yananisis TaxID=1003114 RepID=A0ABY9P9H6_9GAMM|nr:J domain-containing protein [Lysobacter yananisis]WMT02665.1 J domain-containing protein [Lysobacter yananisis]
MNPFAALGLSADADEAQIKRAYAKLLRTNRPDDDPAGFQRLNEAYRQCLESVRRRAAAEVAAATDPAGCQHEDEPDGVAAPEPRTPPEPRMPPAPRPPPVPPAPRDGPTAPQPPAASAPFAPAAPKTPLSAAAPPAPEPTHPQAPAAPAGTPAPVAPGAPAAPVPTPPPAPAAAKTPRAPAGGAAQTAAAAAAGFDTKRFLDELYRHAETDSVAELERWLIKHPALYQFERKHALAPAVIAHLSARPPLYLPQLDALLRFFDLDSVHAHSAGLQARIVELRAQTRRRGVDLREIRFDPDPKPGKRGKHPIEIHAGTIVYLLLGLAIVVRIIAAWAGTGSA